MDSRYSEGCNEAINKYSSIIVDHVFTDLTCSGTIMADPLPVSYPNVVMQGFTPLEA